MKKIIFSLILSLLISLSAVAKTIDQKKAELKKIYEAGGISKVEYEKSIEFLENPKKEVKSNTKKKFSIKNKKTNSKKLFGKKDKDKDEITLEKIEELGEIIKFDKSYYTKGMLKKFTGCGKGMKCVGQKAGSYMWDNFGKSPSWGQKYPGKMIKSMAMYEVFYASRLYDTRKAIERFKKDKYKKGIFSKKQRDEDAIRSLFGMNNGRKNMRKRIQEIESELNIIGKSFERKVILLLTKLNITEPTDLNALAQIKNPLNTLNLLYDINSLYGFNHSLIEMSKKTSTSIANLKSFLLSDEKKMKKSIQMISTFYGLEQHVQLHYPEVLLKVNIDKEVCIMAYDFQTIQLWSNLTSLILDNAEFGSNPIISFTSFKESKKNGININCETLKIKKPIFDNDLLSKRFLDFEEHSTKLNLNIIKTIIDDHNATFKCITEGESINMTLSFNE